MSIRDCSCRAGRALVALLALCSLMTVNARAQSNGAVTGIISDKQGLPLPGATLTLTNAESGVARDTVTSDNGAYRFAAIPPGRYNLRVELQGFASTQITDLTLTIGLEIKRDISMEVEGLQEEVLVHGEAPVVETTRSEVAQVVTQQQIETLPVNNRQAITLALLLPGTSQDGTRPRKVNATVGSGGGFSASAFLVDGVSNQQTSAGEPRQDFPQGGVREFKVNVSQAPAEYGGTTGGVVTMVTKSGTNALSGEAFEYFRDKSLNAMNEFEQRRHDQFGTPKPPFRRNQYGGTLGGPIVMNKAHFLVAADLTETNTPITVNTGKPQLYSSVEGTFGNPMYRRMFLVREDTQISSKQSLFVRWGWENDHTNCETCGGTNAAFSGSRVDQRRNSLVAGHTLVLGNRMLNEFHFQYAPFEFLTAPPGADVWNDPTTYPADRFSQTTMAYVFPSLSWGTSTSRVQKEWWWEFRDDFSITTGGAGTHNWKFGAASVRGPNKDDSASNTLGTWTFGTDQPFNPNDPASIASLTSPILFTASLPPVYRDTKNSWLQLYAQDEWRIAGGLTANLGLRYDLQYDSWNQHMDLSRFPIALPYIDPAARHDHNNFGPRAGLAWDLTSDGKSVMRAGYGRYYRYIFGSFGGEQTNLLQSSIRVANPSYPDPYGGKSPLTFASTAPPNISIVASDIRNPQADMYNVGFSQQLTENLAVHVDGTYTNMSSDTLSVNVNTPDPVTKLKPLPTWGRIVESEPLGKAKYRALLVRFDKRLAQRYTYLISYTLAKSDSNLGGITSTFNPGLDYGPADTDRRNMLVSSGSILLPFDVQLGAVWTLRSKMPFSALAGRDLDGDGSTNDFVPGTANNQGNRNLDINLVNAWRATNGLAPISAAQFDSNRFNSLDVRVSKSIQTGASRKIELVAQLFNVLGTDNLLPPGGDSYVENALSDSFGKILSAQARQQAEVAIRYSW